MAVAVASIVIVVGVVVLVIIKDRDYAKIGRQNLSIGNRPSDLVRAFLPLLDEAKDMVEIHEGVAFYNDAELVTSLRNKLATNANFRVHASIGGREYCRFVNDFRHDSRVTIVFRERDNDMCYKIVDGGMISHLYDPAHGHRQLDLRHVSNNLREGMNRRSLDRWRNLTIPRNYRRGGDGSWIPAVGTDGGGAGACAADGGGAAGC